LLSETGDRDEPWNGLMPETRMGHVHLRVSSLGEAERFYVDLGFDVMARFGTSASFLSAGGYHHHIGINTWAGIGLPAPPPGAVGLRHFVIRLPSPAERDRVVARARAAGVVVEDSPDGVSLSDPSSNRILLVSSNQG